MRELVFELDYRPGWNAVADTLAEYPGAAIRSLSCHVTPDTLWRVDHVQGPPDAVSAIESAYTNVEYFPDCLVTDHCGASAQTEILDRTDESLVIYCVWERSEICTSVPHLALEHIGEGLLFETRQEGRQYRWRIVLGSDDSVGAFTDALQAEIDDVGGMELLRLTDHRPRFDNRRPHIETELSTEQRQALHAAVDHGYYETPRQITITALAEKLDIPQSTLSYRLQRAEAQLATAFATADSAIDSFPTNH